MALSHTKRMAKRQRLDDFRRAMEDSDTLDFLQRTKYHYTISHRVYDFPPVEAYPTTLRLVTAEGDTYNCQSVAEMFTQARIIFQKERMK